MSLKQALLNAAFRGDLTVAWRLATYGTDQLANWSDRALRDIATVASGQTPKGIDNHLSNTGEIMWFKVSSMNSSGNEEFLTNSEFRLSGSTADRLGIRRFPVGTIVFPKRGGAIATNKKRKLGVMAALDLNVMAVTATKVVPEYLWFWFQSLDLSSISNGSNVPQINHGDVEPLVVPIPPEDEQAEIVRQLREAIDQASAAETEVVHRMSLLNRFNQAALAKAFRGELIPNKCKEPESEPVGQGRAQATEILGATRIPA